MTEAELEAIEQRCEQAIVRMGADSVGRRHGQECRCLSCVVGGTVHDVPALLAEVVRLRAVERMARQYVDADPQVRGECYRELVAALNPPQEAKP